MFDKICGMTGTADTEAEEFQQIYNLEVVAIPTHKKMIRNDHVDLVYLTMKEKYRAIVDEVKKIHDKQQPILIGTTSIESSELLSKLLKKEMGFKGLIFSDAMNMKGVLDNKKFRELNSDSIIGTSSFRREFQLRRIRNDLNYKIIRGNVDTRIQKLENGEFDAILLSKAGIDSLKLQNKITQEFSVDELIPCAGQGIIAIQCKKNDSDIIDLLEKINDIETRILANAEREVLKVLEGDCDTAVGVFAKSNGKKVDLLTELFSVDGKNRYFIKKSLQKDNIESTSRMVGEELKLKSKGSYKN